MAKKERQKEAKRKQRNEERGNTGKTKAADVPCSGTAQCAYIT